MKVATASSTTLREQDSTASSASMSAFARVVDSSVGAGSECSMATPLNSPVAIHCTA